MAEPRNKFNKRTGHGVIITQILKVTKDYVDQEKYKKNSDLPNQPQSKLTERLELVQVFEGRILDILADRFGEGGGDTILAKEICDAGGNK